MDILWQTTAVASFVTFGVAGVWFRRQIARLDASRRERRP